MLFPVLIPDVENVAKKAQRHPGIRFTLVLEKAVEQRGGIVYLHHIEQIGLGAAQRFIRVFPRLELDRFPIQPVTYIRRQIVLEKDHGVLDMRERLLEKMVVRVLYGFFTHGPVMTFSCANRLNR